MKVLGFLMALEFKVYEPIWLSNVGKKPISKLFPILSCLSFFLFTTKLRCQFCAHGFQHFIKKDKYADFCRKQTSLLVTPV